jgi:serine/threonine protein phosphatase PrpC
MKIKCHQVSSAGPVRDHNEDFLLFWEPEDFESLQQAGSIAIVADGVGGEGNGDKASRLAAETALSVFKEAKPDTSATALMRQIFEDRKSVV